MWRASSAATIKEQLPFDSAPHPNSSIFNLASAATREKIFLSRRSEDEEPEKQSLRRQRLGARPKLLPPAPLPTSTPRRALHLASPRLSSRIKASERPLPLRCLSKAKCGAPLSSQFPAVYNCKCNKLVVTARHSHPPPSRPTPQSATLCPSGQISAPAPINTTFGAEKKDGYKSS